MEPHLSNNDKKLFYKYLDNTKVYFEYGSGGSTYPKKVLEKYQNYLFGRK